MPKEVPPHEIRTSRMPPFVEQALGTALSRGPGYEPLPAGRAFDERSVRGYYIDYSAKTSAPWMADVEALSATSVIQLALGWWERHVAGDRSALERFLALCDNAAARAVEQDDGLRWFVQVDVPKYGLRAPWSSGLIQGQGASVLVRAHTVTGEDRYATLALGAVAPLLVEGGGQLVTQTAWGAILEEAPSAPPSHILNGWISALWGLWDVGLALDDTRSRERFASSLSALRAHLPAYDTGWWSRYSLYPHALEDLAKPIYHRFHVDQLTALHRLTGHDDIAALAARWAAFDGPARRTLALAQKAAFAVAERRRRAIAGDAAMVSPR